LRVIIRTAPLWRKWISFSRSESKGKNGISCGGLRQAALPANGVRKRNGKVARYKGALSSTHRDKKDGPMPFGEALWMIHTELSTLQRSWLRVGACPKKSAEVEEKRRGGVVIWKIYLLTTSNY